MLLWKGLLTFKASSMVLVCVSASVRHRSDVSNDMLSLACHFWGFACLSVYRSVVFLLESQMFLVTGGGMSGMLVSETLLLPSRGVALIAIDACLSLGSSIAFLLQGDGYGFRGIGDQPWSL